MTEQPNGGQLNGGQPGNGQPGSDTWAAVRQVASDPALPSSGLAERVIAVLRSTVVTRDWCELPRGGDQRGRLRVASSVIVDIARAAAQQQSGVLTLGGELSETELRLDVALPYGVNLIDSAERLRDHVGEVCLRLIGFSPSSVDITVIDVLPPEWVA